MNVTYIPERRAFLVQRPSRPVSQLCKLLHVSARKDGSRVLPDLVRVRRELEEWAGELPGRAAVDAPLVHYRTPSAARPDQRQHIETHLRGMLNRGALSAMLCNQVCCGKTLEAISILATLQPKRTLIICPLGVLGTWRAELQKWLGKQITLKDRKDVWRTAWGGAIVLRHYEALQGNCHNVPATDLLIVDEAHRCSNRGRYTKGTQDAMEQGPVPVEERLLTQAETVAVASRKARHCVLMTGTEARNLLQDVWGLLRLLDPKRYSSFWTFVFCYFQVAENRWGGMDIGGLQPEWADAFRAEVEQWQTRSTRAEVFPELGYEVQVIPVDLEADDQAKFDEMFWGPWWKHHNGPLAAVTWARQFAISPSLVTARPEPTAKLAVAIERLKDADCQMVVCSDFTRALRIIADELGDRACMIVGDRSDKQRVEAITQFERGERQLCLIHPQAGGEGIDLSVGDRLMFLNLPWDLKSFEQVIGRTVRPGRLERGQDPCVIVEVMETTDTIDAYVRQTVIEKAKAYSTLNEETAGKIMAELTGGNQRADAP